MTHIVTTSSLRELLENETLRPHVIGRALVVLFNRQTSSEQTANTTRIVNHRGFTQADARSGSLTAKYYLKYKTLTDWQIRLWMKPNTNGQPRIVKYWKQLDEAAMEKSASRA